MYGWVYVVAEQDLNGEKASRESIFDSEATGLKWEREGFREERQFLQ